MSLPDDPPVCGGGAAWNVAAFRRGGDARSIPRIRIPGEHTCDRSVLVMLREPPVSESKTAAIREVVGP